jgi:hypothetical protein
MNRYLILLLPIILLSVYNAKVPEREAVPYTIIESNDVELLHYIGYKGLRLQFFTDNKSYRLFYLRLHIDEISRPQAPPVDFTRNSVLFISFGKSRTAVYSIKRLKIYIQNNILIVKTEFSPPEYDFVSRAITHHYLLILLPKDEYKRVEWRDARGGRLWKVLWIN